ncbi:MAG: hypothetical protein R3F11_03765 [Verrucomicrobiales bacterium]
MANSARSIMKVSTEGIGTADPITERVEGGGTETDYDTVDGWDRGDPALDKLNASTRSC